MLLQEVYWVRIPESRRAMSIPRRRPETTIERAVALRCGGASSPTKGSMSWGVTVVSAVMKEKAVKTEKDLVIQRLTHCILLARLLSRMSIPVKWGSPSFTIVAVKKTRLRIKGLRRNISPRGHMKRRPAA